MNSSEEPEALSNTGVSPKKTETMRDILREKLIYSRELAPVIIKATTGSQLARGANACFQSKSLQP